MEEQREGIEFVGGDFKAPSMQEAGQGLGLSSQTETLDGDVDVDVTRNESCIEVANTVDVATCDGSLKQVKADFGSVEDVVACVSGEESTEKIIVSCDDVEKTDAITEPATQRDILEFEGDSGTVGVKLVDEIEGSEPVDDSEMKDEMPLSEVKSKNGASHESVGEEEIVTSAGNEVTDEKVKSKVEDHDGAVDGEQNVQTEKSQESSVGAEMFSVAEKKADIENEATKTLETDNNKMDVDSKQESEDKVGVSYNEQGNSGCTDQEKESAKKSEEDNNILDVDNEQVKEEYETTGAKHSESAQDTEESIQLGKGETNKENIETVSEVNPDAEISHVEETTNVNQKEEFGEAMEIDYAGEGQVETDVTVGDVLDNAGNGTAVASMVQTQDIPIAEVDRNDSNVGNVMETDERKDTAMVSDLTGTVESADSANPSSHTAAPGEVEPLDHNTLFDPVSDITNFIDFSGVSSWSGNIQDLKTETGNLSLKEDKNATDMAEEVAKVDGNDALNSVDATANATSHDNLSAEGIHNESSEACVAYEAEASAAATGCPKEAFDPVLESEENLEDNDHDCLDKKTADQQDTVIEEYDITYDAPSSDPNQKEDTEMDDDNSYYADDGTGLDIITNGVKRKADVLNEDSPGEGMTTVSLAKVSFAERPSFKIGACIARAASQMAGSPSLLKGSNFGDETLSVESFVAQLHCAATDPVNENGVSDIGVGFFLDFRNSLASQHVTPEIVHSKRVKTSNSSAGGTETFEFQEMDDTYWTDRMIHNGCEEQTPPTEKGSYQIVPVELKPVQRTRRPYRRRQSQINVPLPASDKPANFDENAPAELIMKFSESDTIPPETSLSKMFKRFGPIRESQTEVDSENNRARVVFKKGGDAKVAYNSAGRFNIFGTKTVNYELSHTITETFKVQPYVVSLSEENAALYLPS